MAATYSPTPKGDDKQYRRRDWAKLLTLLYSKHKKELRILIELRTLVKMAATYSPTPKGDDKQYHRRDWA